MPLLGGTCRQPRARCPAHVGDLKPWRLEPGYRLHFSLHVFWQIIVMPAQTVKGSHWWIFLWPEQALSSSNTGDCWCSPLLMQGNKTGKRGLHPLLLCSLLPRAAWTCKSCCGTVVVYHVRGCGVVMDAKVMPGSSYGPVCSWNIRGQQRTIPSEATRVKYKWKDANLIIQMRLLFIQQMLFDPGERIIL